MDPPNFHSVKSQQIPCHRLLASAADQDEAEGDDMAFVYKQNLVYIYSLHLIAKFINIDQNVLLKSISCF
jgi:hypothetical protein